jgi:ribosomal protein S18 acetylase RimI-like enzyme
MMSHLNGQSKVNTKLLGYELLNANPDVLMHYMQDLLNLDKCAFSVCWNEENFLLELPKKWELSYLVISKNKAISFIIASMKEKMYHIHRLGVAPGYQRQGIGYGLLNILTNQAANDSIHSISLKVAKDNENAIKFYELNGLKIAGRSNSHFLMTKEVLPCLK